MSHEDMHLSDEFQYMKKLKEKVRRLVSDVTFGDETAKFKHENEADAYLSGSESLEENEDEFFDYIKIECLKETSWLTEENDNGESVRDICLHVYADINDNRPDVTTLCRQLEAAFESNAYGNQRTPIDSRTFTRSKKNSARPSLTAVLNSEENRPKLQRRLTTTITPSPNLVSKLEELSRNNNRPVSGNYDDSQWETGAEEGMAEIKKPPPRTKRQSLPASLFNRLQELKKANSSLKISNIDEGEATTGDGPPNPQKNYMLEDATKVTAALDFDMRNSNSSRLAEIFRNTQEYYSDDNESFISLDEVSGFCDRLTLSTDQNTYSSIVREMEQHEICLFHRPMRGTEAGKKGNLTFEGIEIPRSYIPNVASPNEKSEEETDLNRTYEIENDKSSDDRMNGTFEISRESPRENVMNATYDANRKQGLVDAVMQSDVLKKLSPGRPGLAGKFAENSNFNENGNDGSDKNHNRVEGDNINASYVINNRSRSKVLGGRYGGVRANETFEKRGNDAVSDQNELNALKASNNRYSTKIFDSSFEKNAETEPSRVVKSASAKRRSSSSNGKRDQSDHSEEDRMSTTSDASCRSADSNSEVKARMSERRTSAIRPRQKFSTPITGQMEKLNFDVVSPIKMEMGDGECRAYSNPSSRGQSPRRGIPSMQEGIYRQRMPNLRQPLKVPQKELKLKPALIRPPSQNFKRPFSYARTSSEPSVPQKVENFQAVASVPALRPSGPAAAPSLTNVRPSSRTSGIPRPPTRLKPPQIRLNYSKQ